MTNRRHGRVLLDHAHPNHGGDFDAAVAAVGFEKPAMLAYGRSHRNGDTSGRPMIPWTRIASAQRAGKTPANSAS